MPPRIGLAYCEGLVSVAVSDMLLAAVLEVCFFMLAALTTMRWLRLTTKVSFNLVYVVKGVAALTFFRLRWL